MKSVYVANDFVGKSNIYIQKQLKNIEKYGKGRTYPNVKPDVLEQFTPNRRLSKKKCTLYDKQYFIDKFEDESYNEIPEYWGKMSDLNKVDFIVKNRYERIVSNKIMNSLKDSKVEHSYILSTDGKIKYYGTNNSTKNCPVPLELAKNSICIHNHPKQIVSSSYWTHSELGEVNSVPHSFSRTDLLNGLSRHEKKAYLIDFLGNKYKFVPNYDYENRTESETYINAVSDILSSIQQKSFNKNKKRSIRTSFNEFYAKTTKFINDANHELKWINWFENM